MLAITLTFPFFFFNDTATTEIYTLSLHDALPILARRGPHRRRVLGHVADGRRVAVAGVVGSLGILARPGVPREDRKSTRLNSSHSQISYAVFCLKKKKKKK